MGFLPVLWVLWGASFLLMAGVSLVAARAGRNEEDQLFLADSSSRVKTEQADISAKLDRIQPLRLASFWLAGAMTVFVIGYYIFDMVRQFR